LVAGSRALRTLTTLLLVASAACTRDFDGLLSQGDGATSGKPDASSAGTTEACKPGMKCAVACNGPQPCDYTCPVDTVCTVQCATKVECTCTGASCDMVCDGTMLTCGTTTACNRKCP
jgi:hypothetical protein